jgi:cytidyltransferase-like protein
MHKFSVVATGGTFDGLHAGHKSILERSFELADAVVIGLTSDEFARKEGKSPLHTYEERRAGLEEFIHERYPGRNYTIAKLEDYFGPGIASREVEALVASPETGERVKLANAIRAKRGYPPLELVVVDWVEAEDGEPISSTRIRRGEIDDQGRLLKHSTTRGRPSR